MPHELLVFKNADSRSKDSSVFPGMSYGFYLRKYHSATANLIYGAGAPHASFHNPNFKIGDFLRESIEIRTLVSYDF